MSLSMSHSSRAISLENRFSRVLILEAMAQATGILAFKSVGKLEPGELYYFAGIDEARFKRPVVPGDQMIMEVTFENAPRPDPF